MTLGERLLKFIKTCYGTQVIFADKIGMDISAINRYIHNKSAPSLEILVKFGEAGVSIDWLLRGKGSMYSYDYDKALQNIVIEEVQTHKNETIERIKQWIFSNYDTLESFASVAELDIDELNSIINGFYLPDKHIFYGLFKAGCNLDWIISGKGNHYVENESGLILSLKNDANENKGKESSNLENESLKEVLNNPSEKLLSIIKNIVKNELDERQNEKS